MPPCPDEGERWPRGDLALVLFGGDVVVVSSWLVGALVLVFVVAPLLVLFTATFGHLRAKRTASEREIRDELEQETFGE